MTNGPFSRVVAIHDAERPERSILAHAAALAGLGGGDVTIAATPSTAMRLAFGDPLAPLFAAHGTRVRAIRALADPDVDAILETATVENADLLVVRNPRTSPRRDGIARRLLAAAPCAIAFVPPCDAPRRFTRVLAGVVPGPEGLGTVELASQLCSAAGADELVAVRSRFHDTLAAEEEVREGLRAEAFLELHRFLADVPRNGTRIVPVLEERRRWGRALLDVAGERQADLVVVGRPADPRFAVLRGGSETLDLLRECPLPLLVAPPRPSTTGALRRLRDGLFRETEPPFR